MIYNILVVKETRAGESRVALTPNDVEAMIKNGHSITVEKNAGLEAGYNDKTYQDAGASIVKIAESKLSSYKDTFKNFNMIVRVKRPDLQREKLENKAFQAGTIMVGALDPFEKKSSHTNEYRSAGILAYSIDQAKLSPTDPMNLLAAMSRLTGQLALNDAISKCNNNINKVVIIGVGTAGQSALDEAVKLKLPVTAIVRNKTKAIELQTLGINTFVINRTSSLQHQQRDISTIISDADIVITTARKAGEKAPLLIPMSSLDKMKQNAVIVDLALSEGGNVYGSQHDKTITTEGNVLITNVSGYPKIMPREASTLWSKASLHFIIRLAKDPGSIALKQC